MNIGSNTVQALFDTGAESLVMTRAVFEAARSSGTKYRIMPKVPLESVSGDPIPVYMTVRMVTLILGRSVAATWHVSDAIAYDMVLGMNIIGDRMDYVQGKVGW